MTDQYVSLGLLALLIFQQVYFTMTINRLINKLMSRNYAEYVQANSSIADKIVVKTDTEPHQDLNELFGLGPQS